MSDKLGNIDYANEQHSFLGPYSGQVVTSQDSLEIIDAEVRRLVDEGYTTAKNILTEKIEDLHRLAKGLIEYETLTGKDIELVLKGEPLQKDDDNPPEDQKRIFTVPTTTRRPSRDEKMARDATQESSTK